MVRIVMGSMGMGQSHDTVGKYLAAHFVRFLMLKLEDGLHYTLTQSFTAAANNLWCA